MNFVNMNALKVFFLSTIGAFAALTADLQAGSPVSIHKGEGMVVVGMEEPIDDDCRCEGIPLYGRVKVVEAFADFKVKIVSSFPDLKVKTVSAFADECGEWQFVESFPDFTVQFVESFPDFTIQFVENFPGL